jgi:hypothetical protein
VTSAPAGITCDADCEQKYRAGTVVTLTAVPNGNADFSGWTGPCSGSAPTCEVTLRSDDEPGLSRSVRAGFDNPEPGGGRGRYRGKHAFLDHCIGPLRASDHPLILPR